MPSDAEVRRQAALDDLHDAVSGIAHILRRIAENPITQRDRRLLRVVGSQLARIRHAVRVLDET
jgi:hypothetical protein